MNDVTNSLNCVTGQGCQLHTFVLLVCNSQLKLNIMGSLLYIIAVILIIGWAIGFFAYSAGGIIHILLVIALIAIIIRVIQGRKVV